LAGSDLFVLSVLAFLQSPSGNPALTAAAPTCRTA